MGAFASLGANTLTRTHYYLNGSEYAMPTEAGFAWGIGIDAYIEPVRVSIPLLFLNPGQVYLVACGEADLFRMLTGESSSERPYVGLGFGLGNLSAWDDTGLNGSTFAFSFQLSGGIVAVNAGLLWLQAGTVIANTDFGSSGNATDVLWYLMAGISLGASMDTVNDFLGS